MAKKIKRPGLLDAIKDKSKLLQAILILGGILLIFGAVLVVLSVIPIGRTSYVHEGYEYSFYLYNLWSYWYLLVPSLILIVLAGGIFGFLLKSEIKETKVYLIYLIVLSALLVGVSLALNIIIDETGTVNTLVRIVTGIITLIALGLLCISPIELVKVMIKVKALKENEETLSIEPEVDGEKPVEKPDETADLSDEENQS